MKRSIKNIIMISIAVLTIIGIIVTMHFAQNSSVNTQTSNNTQNSVTPQMPNDQNNNSNSNQNTPPEKPDNNSSNNNQNTPPEKPEDNSSNDTQNNNQTTTNDNSASTQNNAPNMQGQDNMQTQMPNSTNTLGLVYYILYITEGLIISVIIMYLIMSKFNKKTFKETFENKDKIIISILSIIILTTIISYTNIKLTQAKTNTPSQTAQVTYSAQEEITENTKLSNKTYTSKKADENAILVTNNTSTLSNITVTKKGNSNSGDNSNFYGNNSAILAKDKAILTLKNINVITKANGANGVFCYGGSATTTNTSSDGTTINIKNSKIKTTGDNAGGIMTTGGGITNATNLTITTEGTSSAAIRTDRGGGTVNVNKGTYETKGQGSPVIYSTANITVKNATLKATASEGVVIEGKNKVNLNNVTLTDTNNKLNGKSTTYKNIFIYQSMSGDADEGTATFTTKDSKITTNKGDTLYVTNTKAKITLENNTITNNDKTSSFLRIQKDSWGNEGQNGGDVTLTLKNQKANGNIVVDSISTLNMKLKNNSYYEGAINEDKTAKSIKLTLDKTSKIKLTKDSYVTSLTDEDESYSNIDFNGYKLYVNGKAIN